MSGINPESGCKCQGCGVRYSADLIVPDDTWEQIKPEGKELGAGLLCANCIMSRLVAIGWSVGHLTKTAPCELAELQAKCELSDIRISQLTVAIEQSSKAQLENYHMATRAWTENKELQAAIARLMAEIERLKGEYTTVYECLRQFENRFPNHTKEVYGMTEE